MIDLTHRLRVRSQIRKQISGRKSVQEGKPDRLCDLLEEAADEIERLQKIEKSYTDLKTVGALGLVLLIFSIVIIVAK